MANRYQFPLNNQTYYGGKVTFQAFETIPPDIRVTDVSAVEEDENEATPLSIAAVTSKIDNAISNVTVSNEKKVPLDKCTLFLPNAFNFQDGVQYDEFSLGKVGAATEAALNSGASAMGAAGAAFGAGISSIVSSVTDVFKGSTSGDIARLAAVRLSKWGGQEVEAGVKSALRVTANPNKRLLFREVNLREFSFNFKLIPTSKEEAEEITKIIKFFRTELYPEDTIRVEAGGISIPIGYKFPNQFIITIKHNEREIAHKILPSYLYGIQITYNPTAMGFFEDGNFTETEMTLTFRESRTLAKADVKSGGY